MILIWNYVLLPQGCVYWILQCTLRNDCAKYWMKNIVLHIVLSKVWNIFITHRLTPWYIIPRNGFLHIHLPMASYRTPAWYIKLKCTSSESIDWEWKYWLVENWTQLQTLPMNAELRKTKFISAALGEGILSSGIMVFIEVRWSAVVDFKFILWIHLIR